MGATFIALKHVKGMFNFAISFLNECTGEVEQELLVQQFDCARFAKANHQTLQAVLPQLKHFFYKLGPEKKLLKMLST